ncbi:hypothetical protein TrVE_jg3722 [Triparma verrucosa]|uniref:Uncharacterized protein n=2 Tax=Triparma verrucosa TaxID=1606542 RepID=A0A9W7BTL9_9STRA|nr:hypothetical protein TrVE_jg3722 [Triparma verrucosa]
MSSSKVIPVDSTDQDPDPPAYNTPKRRSSINVIALIRRIPQRRRFLYITLFLIIQSLIASLQYQGTIARYGDGPFTTGRFFLSCWSASMYTVSPYIMGSWVFPHHAASMPKSHKITFVVFWLALFSAYLMEGSFVTWLLHPMWFFAIHVMYANEFVNPESPPTYVKYTIPVAYFLLIVKTIVDWLELGFGVILFSLIFLYLMTVAILLLAFDRPLRQSSEVVAEITDSGYYFSTIFYVSTVIGSSLGLLLVNLRTTPSLLLTCILQLVSLLLLEVAIVFSKRTTDQSRFQPLMLQIYFQIDMIQTFLFLRPDVTPFGLTWTLMLLVQEIFSLIKFGGVYGFIVYNLTEFIYKEYDYIVKARIYGVGKNGTTFDYNYTQCSVTCVGWNVEDGEGPGEGRGFGEVTFLFAVLAGVAVMLLIAERWLLTSMEGRLMAVIRDEGRGGDTAKGRQSVKEIVRSAAGVFMTTPMEFLFVSFWLGVNSAVYGMYASANVSGIVEKEVIE